ncbi:MAG: dodecin domain-containing protein [Firmicutes bacterium]|nr:dodecin domain-containing protein [Bacillota bacterium]
MSGVAKVIELIGESDSGWEDAVKDAVQKASQTVEGISGVEVLNFTASVEQGEVAGYKANVKLAFGVKDR